MRNDCLRLSVHIDCFIFLLTSEKQFPMSCPTAFLECHVQRHSLKTVCSFRHKITKQDYLVIETTNRDSAKDDCDLKLEHWDILTRLTLVNHNAKHIKQTRKVVNAQIKF